MISEKIVSACNRGNRSAQKTLYKTFAQKMFMHCYRYVKHKEDAEEILSEGFIKVFANLSKIEYRDAKSFEGWLKRIMINESLMFLRKQKIKFSDQEDISQMQIVQSLDDDLIAEDIYRLIRSLPIGYRTVFNLNAIEGYSHKEISQKLNISESTSRSQLTKARKKLQELMAERK